MKALVIAVIALCALTVAADNWAVIVAGSSGFYNYRHQADVCHAYQILKADGIDESKIILMSYNDVQSSTQNPFPNQLFNKPSGTEPGVDVNAGCKIEYSGRDVTPENYMHVLKGEADKVPSGKRVLQSGPTDYVFLNFADHGGSGLIAFPHSYLYADQLLDTLAAMRTNKMYKQITYYMEACESGSMFVDLPTNTKVYAVSASSPYESSWGYYCPPDDEVNGTHLGTCLGDLFSICWMEDSDKADTTTETLATQYENVKACTTKSQSMQWGETDFTNEPIGDFLGKKQPKKGLLRQVYKYFQRKPRFEHMGFDSRDVKLNFLMNQFQKHPTAANLDELQEELFQIRKFNRVFDAVRETFELNGVNMVTTNFDCYRTAIDALENKCGKVNEFSYRYFKYLYQFCAGNAAQVDMLSELFDTLC